MSIKLTEIVMVESVKLSPRPEHEFEVFNLATGEGCGKFFGKYFADKHAIALMCEEPGLAFAVRPLRAGGGVQ